MGGWEGHFSLQSQEVVAYIIRGGDGGDDDGDDAVNEEEEKEEEEEEEKEEEKERVVKRNRLEFITAAVITIDSRWKARKGRRPRSERERGAEEESPTNIGTTRGHTIGDDTSGS